MSTYHVLGSPSVNTVPALKETRLRWVHRTVSRELLCNKLKKPFACAKCQGNRKQEVRRTAWEHGEGVQKTCSSTHVFLKEWIRNFIGKRNGVFYTEYQKYTYTISYIYIYISNYIYISSFIYITGTVTIETERRENSLILCRKSVVYIT